MGNSIKISIFLIIASTAMIFLKPFSSEHTNVKISLKEQLNEKGDSITIVAFGDSLTYGTGAPREFSYPSQLSKIINIEVINEGLPGETTKGGLKRLPLVLKKYRPDILIITEGGNDMLKSTDYNIIKANLKKMAEMANQNGVKVILLGTPAPNAFYLKDPSFYKEVASETSAIYIDNIFSKVLSNSSLKSDLIHPNAEGYAIIAKEIAKVFKGEGK